MNEKEKIANYSKDVFFKSGFYKITMDEIAQGLRVSKKTIYKYFPSKNILLENVIKAFMNSTKKRLLKNISEQENSILKIKSLTEAFAELSLKLNQKLLYDLQTHMPELWESVESFRGEVIKSIWEDIINQGKKEGYIVDKPNDIIITVIYAAIRSIINPTFLLNHNYSINEAFKITFDLLIQGLLTPEGLKVYKNIEKENTK
ncbi:MAG: TetR/AcrR family transcriptional regulator [Ignavibacteriae bacterium]|nr:TetR/AcrR family transcriptional regulator [Ignavibacteriota bacterium]MCB9249905.1 TetR/AcrR family transcriptional regulator [Ignavibacteriales bacterium]